VTGSTGEPPREADRSSAPRNKRRRRRRRRRARGPEQQNATAVETGSPETGSSQSENPETGRNVNQARPRRSEQAAHAASPVMTSSGATPPEMTSPGIQASIVESPEPRAGAPRHEGAPAKPRPGGKRRRRRGSRAGKQRPSVPPIDVNVDQGASSSPQASSPAAPGPAPIDARENGAGPGVGQAGGRAPSDASSGLDSSRRRPAASNRANGRHGESGVYAALDLGTNNCRLLVARPASRSFKVVDAFSRIVRLGEGLFHSGRLSDDAMDRALEALAVCRDKLVANGVSRHRLIATEACRKAENGIEFLERVRTETGLNLEVVSRETEAELAVSGCSSLIDPRATGVVVFDIGGGSTELAILEIRKRNGHTDPAIGKRIVGWTSLPVGVVGIAERYGGVEVSRETFEQIVGDVGEMLEDFKALGALDKHARRNVHLLGTSGTVTTIAGVHLGLARYDRRRVDGTWMGPASIKHVHERLQSMSYEERAANACIGRERADLVLSGCAIFEAIRRRWPWARVRVADRGLREGILMTLMREDSVWPRPAQRGH
jgi:exopolyphosphatase/guanosine-5'-triphosphate,3'-diphosphate pyrophosphatase